MCGFSFCIVIYLSDSRIWSKDCIHRNLCFKSLNKLKKDFEISHVFRSSPKKCPIRLKSRDCDGQFIYSYALSFNVIVSELVPNYSHPLEWSHCQQPQYNVSHLKERSHSDITHFFHGRHSGKCEHSQIPEQTILSDSKQKNCVYLICI